MRNKHYSITCSDGTVKNFQKWHDGVITMQTIRNGKILPINVLRYKGGMEGGRDRT